MGSGFTEFKVSLLSMDIDEFVTIDTLFLSMIGMRNKSMIRHLFPQVEAEVILIIVLGSRNNHDRLVWNYSPDGEYSTKSDYSLSRVFKPMLQESVLTIITPHPSSSLIVAFGNYMFQTRSDYLCGVWLWIHFPL